MHQDNSILAFTPTGNTLLDVILTYGKDSGAGFCKVKSVDKVIWEVK
jgi:hypothetical protein